MAAVQTQIGVDIDPAARLVSLEDKLDTLWTTYLNNLDAYTQSQKLIQKHMSAGFLSLARANFNARQGVRRYGKDFYHDRVVATRCVEVSTFKDGKASVQVVTRHVEVEGEESDDPVKVEKTGERDEEVKQQPSPPATPEHDVSSDARQSDDEQKNEKPSAAHKSPLESDPLRWFGIFIPSALRSAQASFSSAVGDAVADAVNSAKGMRECEVEIRKSRKEIRRVEREAEK